MSFTSLSIAAMVAFNIPPAGPDGPEPLDDGQCRFERVDGVVFPTCVEWGSADHGPAAEDVELIASDLGGTSDLPKGCEWTVGPGFESAGGSWSCSLRCEGGSGATCHSTTVAAVCSIWGPGAKDQLDVEFNEPIYCGGATAPDDALEYSAADPDPNPALPGTCAWHLAAGVCSYECGGQKKAMCTDATDGAGGQVCSTDAGGWVAKHIPGTSPCAGADDSPAMSLSDALDPTEMIECTHTSGAGWCQLQCGNAKIRCGTSRFLSHCYRQVGDDMDTFEQLTIHGNACGSS